MKKHLKRSLQPGSNLFFLLFLLFAGGALYFSLPYGILGMAVCVLLRVISLRSDAQRKRHVQELMDNIEVEGGEIHPAVTFAAADGGCAGYDRRNRVGKRQL